MNCPYCNAKPSEQLGDITVFECGSDTRGLGGQSEKCIHLELNLLRSELAGLRSGAMRRADKPDCLGIWVTQLGEFLIIDTELRLNDVKGEKAPYFYYGPIPVIPKDLPKIKEFKLRRSNGLEINAVRYGVSKNYHRVLEDGSVGDVVEGSFQVLEAGQ